MMAFAFILIFWQLGLMVTSYMIYLYSARYILVQQSAQQVHVPGVPVETVAVMVGPPVGGGVSVAFGLTANTK